MRVSRLYKVADYFKAVKHDICCYVAMAITHTLQRVENVHCGVGRTDVRSLPSPVFTAAVKCSDHPQTFK